MLDFKFCINMDHVGFYLAQSEIKLIQDWPFLPHTLSLLFIIGLCGFYIRYWPWSKTNIKPLQKLQRSYHQKPILLISWKSELISLFNACKQTLLLLLFLLDMIVQSQWSLRWIGLLVGLNIFWHSIATLHNLWHK